MSCKITDRNPADAPTEHPSKATSKIRRERFIELLTDEGGFEAMSFYLERLAPLAADIVSRVHSRSQAAGLIAALTQLAASSAFTLVGTDEDPGMHHCDELGGLMASFFDVVAGIHASVIEDMKREHEPIDSVSERRAQIAPPSSSMRINCEKCQHRQRCATSDLRKHITEMAQAEKKMKAQTSLNQDDVANRAQRSVDDLIRAINTKGIGQA